MWQVLVCGPVISYFPGPKYFSYPSPAIILLLKYLKYKVMSDIFLMTFYLTMGIVNKIKNKMLENNSYFTKKKTVLFVKFFT